ncbi:MAG: hypothetical protein K6F94_05785 [Bacteroidaceae bacterium]|nr:hypothetical protein [Bacteroidaceae bacterium]
MKKYLWLCLMALACLPFIACGGNDEDETGVETEEQVYTEPEITDTGNKLVLTYSTSAYNLTTSTKWTCEFENALCTSSIVEVTYPSEAIARESYQNTVEDLDDDEPNIYSINGRVVTANTTEDYKGTPKASIKAAMEILKQRYSK